MGTERSAKKFKRLLSTKQKSKRQWMKRKDNAAANQYFLQGIEKAIGDSSPVAHRTMANGLLAIGNWRSVKGQVALLDGDPTGWQDIFLGWRYETLSLRITISDFQKQRFLGDFREIGTLTSIADRCALHIAFAVVCSCDFELKFFGETLRTMLYDKEAVHAEHWRYHGVGPFMSRLIRLAESQNATGEMDLVPIAGPYDSIMKSWEHQETLGSAILSACDFHCERLNDNSEDFFSEFVHAPFDLFPAEILSIYSIRGHMGLATPRVEHPLLAAPFDAPIGSPSNVADELLDRIEEGL